MVYKTVVNVTSCGHDCTITENYFALFTVTYHGFQASVVSLNMECKDLHGYLKTLPSAVLDLLYNHPATCLAIFRDLPELTKHVVMRLLFCDAPTSQTVITSWVLTPYQQEYATNLKVLTQLRIWKEAPGGMSSCQLNESFRNNLKVALLGGGNPWVGSGLMETDKYSKDVEFLDSYATERWECLLHYMVQSKEGSGGISKDTIETLKHSGLVKNATLTECFITPAGFQFLLMDTASQVWQFMLQYLNTVDARNLNLVETLSFLFQLSFMTLGKDYSTDGMTEAQLKFLQNLRELGLVYQRKRKSQRFYPTRLATYLATTKGGAEATHLPKQGYVMLETNYRVYAYTDSSLKVALLALFCKMLYRFPNVVVAVLSRDSVRTALSIGITAQQIINYLQLHAHPEMLKQTPVLPPTVTDQIRLWELERDRFKFSDGVLYNQFLSQTDFELLRDYARDLGVLVWDNSASRNMVVTKEGHDDVKRFWKRHRSS